MRNTGILFFDVLFQISGLLIRYVVYKHRCTSYVCTLYLVDLLGRAVFSSPQVHSILPVYNVSLWYTFYHVFVDLDGVLPTVVLFRSTVHFLAMFYAVPRFT